MHVMHPTRTGSSKCFLVSAENVNVILIFVRFDSAADESKRDEVFQNYLRAFDGAAARIQRRKIVGGNGTEYHPMITCKISAIKPCPTSRIPW